MNDPPFYRDDFFWGYLDWFPRNGEWSLLFPLHSLPFAVVAIRKPIVRIFTRARSRQIRSYQTGSQRGGPWSPGALSFCWLEPWSFFGYGARSPKTFCAEPGAQHFQVWSFEFPDCIDSLLLPFCVCLCVLTGIRKQNLKRGQYIIQVYAVISVYNDMQQLI